MTTRALIGLGISQCINWGALYYAFAVLVVPLQRELGVETWVVTGAFSVALLTSAVLAPAVGRWGDQDRGAMVMQAGGVIAAALLAGWTLVPGVFMLYVVWAALGLCMAMTLYEPAFNFIGHAHKDPAKRLRAIAAVTVFGGVASTVFLPLTALLLDALGWRGTVLALAALVAASTALARALVFRGLAIAPVDLERSARREPDAGFRPARFTFIAMTFALTSLTSAGFAANLVPALGNVEISPRMAAMLGGLMGVMQLPGRALMMNDTFAPSPWILLTVSLALLASGLASVAGASSIAIVVVGTMAFGLGAGLTTLVRPHLVQTMFSTAVGHLNGRIARQQQLARAVGPLGVAWGASHVGYTKVFAALAAAFTLTAFLSAALARTADPSSIREEVA